MLACGTGRALIAGFSLALAWFAMQTFGPPTKPEYVIRFSGPALAIDVSESRSLYLRRTFYLANQPDAAWLSIAANDDLTLYVNGTNVARASMPGGPVTVQADIGSHLQVGRNVIAISSWSVVAKKDPTVWVEGSYHLSDGAHSIGVDNQWRYTTVFDQKGFYWFSPDFNDRNWSTLEPRNQSVHGTVDSPPRSLRASSRGNWISPAQNDQQQTILRREFSLYSKPKTAWLRVLTQSPYRIAVNGTIIGGIESNPSDGYHTTPTRTIYDLTPFLKLGQNSIALAFDGRNGVSPVQIAGEVEINTNNFVSLDADDRWLSQAGHPPDWLAQRVNEPAAWQHALLGTVGLPQENIRSGLAKTERPLRMRIWRTTKIAGMAIFIAIATLLACHWFASRYSALARPPSGPIPNAAVYFTLLPSLLLVVLLHIASFDSRIPDSAIYHPGWLALVVGIIPLQWWGLVRTRFRPLVSSGFFQRYREALIPSAMCLLVVIGTLLRFHDIGFMALHPDEITVYRAAQGVFEFGFPGFSMSDDTPISFVATSELLFFGTTISEVLFDQDYLVVRAPAVFWGILTIILIYRVGSRMFNRWVGIIAAAWYSIAASAIEMTHFGRYFSLLQFTTLLTVYVFWLTIDGNGRPKNSHLVALAASFTAMYFSWEGVGIIAAGFAIAAIVHRWGHLKSILGAAPTWGVVAIIAIAASFQMVHRVSVQTTRLIYGTGASDTAVTGMWNFPPFDISYYFWESSWVNNALVPITGLVVAVLLTLRRPFKREIRYLLIILATTCVLMSLLLPVRAERYGTHMQPLVILITAASLYTVARATTRAAIRCWRVRPPPIWRPYAKAVGFGLAVVVLLLGSGRTLNSKEMSLFQVRSTGQPNPDHLGGKAFLREHYHPGDIVITSTPHALMVPPYEADYWLETKLHLQAILGDSMDLGRDRLTATPMLSSIEDLEYILARHPRVWYVAMTGMHEKLNTTETSSYLRRNMQVAYEDNGFIILFAGDVHRPAMAQLQSEQELERAKAKLLGK